jgi:hypothetical protein
MSFPNSKIPLQDNTMSYNKYSSNPPPQLDLAAFKKVTDKATVNHLDVGKRTISTLESSVHWNCTII